MTKEVPKSEALADSDGARDVGVDTTDGLSGPKVQDALDNLLERVQARLFGTRYEDGTPTVGRKYLNFSGNVAVDDNADLDSIDVEILEQDFRWMGPWDDASVSYNQDDFVTDQGGIWRSKLSHTSAPGNAPPTLPTESNTQWEIAAKPGADGPGPGGAHASTHKGDGSDAIAAATTIVNGLMASADKTKLNGIETGAKATHNNLSGLTTGDPHTQYALSDGTRLVVASSVSSPATNQLRMNGQILQRWNGTAWVSVRADVDPLAPLGVDPTDMATGYSIVAHVTSLTRPTSAIEGQVIYETDTEIYMYNVSETLGSPSWTPLVPSVESWRLPYADQTGASSVFCAWGYGDPADAVGKLNVSDSTAQPTANDLGSNVVRLVKFRLPRNLNVADARLFCRAGDSTLRYRLGIYRVADGIKMWDSTPFGAGTSGEWTTLTGGFPVTLTAETNYWLAWTTTNPNGTNHFYTRPAQVAADVYGAATGPLSNRSIGVPELARVATTGGALADPLPTVLAANWADNRGTLPFVFLSGTAS
jgi:hypothetical protein